MTHFAGRSAALARTVALTGSILWTAAADVPAYQQILQNGGVDPAGIHSLEDFCAQVRGGRTVGKLAGTVTQKQERKSRNGNRIGHVASWLIAL